MAVGRKSRHRKNWNGKSRRTQERLFLSQARMVSVTFNGFGPDACGWRIPKLSSNWCCIQTSTVAPPAVRIEAYR